MSLKSFFVLWAPVALWCLIIFAFSSIPTPVTAKIIWWDFVLKKSAHITEYAILYYLVFRAFSREFRIKNLELRIINKKVKINFYLLSLLFALLYSFSDEYHQHFVPGRHMKLMDIGFDFLGMLIAYFWLKKNLYKNQTKDTSEVS